LPVWRIECGWYEGWVSSVASVGLGLQAAVQGRVRLRRALVPVAALVPGEALVPGHLVAAARSRFDQADTDCVAGEFKPVP
jgi:hypothetical protein